MMSLIWASIAGFFAGFIGGLGMGGGGVLVLFLTLYVGMPQLQAQGINLLFFIPVGLFALILHVRQHLIDFKAALPAILLGLLGAAVGSFLARFFGSVVISKIFAVLLACLGVWEVFAPKKAKA
jgi:uncharacterized membrane protein YfcA